jgi:putative aminopeptidase FrvX
LATSTNVKELLPECARNEITTGVDVALGWPLRYSHSPAKVIDTKDLDALGKIVAVLAKSW